MPNLLMKSSKRAAAETIVFPEETWEVVGAWEIKEKASPQISKV